MCFHIIFLLWLSLLYINFGEKIEKFREITTFSPLLWLGTAYLFYLGGYEYFIKVITKARAAHFLGEDHEAKNIELFTDYKVNGVPGSGISEWNYRNIRNDMDIWASL